MKISKFGFGGLLHSMKSSNIWAKEIGVTFKSIDDIIKNANTLVLKCGKYDGKHWYVIPQPVMMTLENPLMRFSCMPKMRRRVAKSVAESIYALSGMNGSDFIWEFRGLSGPGNPDRTVYCDFESIGQPLRFWNEQTGKILNYSNSNYLRQQGTGFVDQFQKALTHLINSDDSFVISLREPNRAGGRAHSAWLRRDDAGRLRMTVSCGEINVDEDLTVRVIPAFAFIQQMLSEVTKIPMGTLTIMVAALYGLDLNRVKELAKAELPVVGGLTDFAYPASNLTLRDVDNLISMMQEFVGRLDEKALSRANPFEGDQRVQLWHDMANVFKEYEADQLGIKITTPTFFHPQLRFIYAGEST